MDINIVDKNGNVTVDAKTIDETVDGYENQEVIKCPNLYGLDNSALGVSSDYETMEDLTKGLLTNWNFEDGTTGWSKSTNATFSVTDGIASLGGDGNDDYIQKTFTLTAGRTYVFIIRGKNNNGFPNYFQQGFSEQVLPFTTEYKYVRFVATIGSTQTSFGIKIGPVQPDSYDRTGTILNLDTVSVFDITDLKSKAIYSPEYNDTFDNITNNNAIAYQLQILTEGKDYYGTPSDYVNDSYADFKTAANGTGSGLLNGRYYFNYDNDVIHDLLAIYGSGKEPSLETHEALIPQYTNTVLKAKAFANTLQQEFMELTLTTPINLLEEYTLTDVFVNSQAVSTPAETLAILEDIYETLAETTILTGTAFVLGQFYVDYDNFKAYDIVDINRRLPIYNNLSLNQIFGTYDTTGATVIEEAETPTRSIVLLNGNYYYINGNYKAKTFATLYTMAQYDSMLEYYKGEVLELLSVKSSLDTPVYEGLSLRDIFENDTDGITLPNGIKTFEIGGNDLVQRVMKYTLQENNTISIADLTNVQIIILSVSGREPSDANGLVQGLTIVEGYQEIGSLDRDILGNENMFYTFNNNLTLVQPLGTYSTLVEAKTSLIGTKIWYQLASPIVLQTFTTAPSQSQLDEWLDMYLTLKDNETLITDYLAKTRMLPLIVKAKIYKDRFVILGEFTEVGQD